jgi:serine/threonine protein kinase
LGEGNFGEVYKATLSGQGVTSTAVAVKTLKTADIDARSQLLREAALMALLDHSNIVAAIGEQTGLICVFWLSEGLPFYAIYLT